MQGRNHDSVVRIFQKAFEQFHRLVPFFRLVFYSRQHFGDGPAHFGLSYGARFIDEAFTKWNEKIRTSARHFFGCVRSSHTHDRIFVQDRIE